MKKSELKQMIREELLKEGADQGTLGTAITGLKYTLKDLENALTGRNLSKEYSFHPQANDVLADIAKIEKILNGWKKYDQKTKLWFRDSSLAG